MSTPEEVLKQEDMEATRSPRDLCAWVEAKVSEFGKTEEGKAYARSGSRLPKKLMEEIRPFGLFALNRFGPDAVTCTPNLGSENFDGVISFPNSSEPPLFVEITYAKDGHDERLRMSVLSAIGSVNAIGTLTVTGTKAARNQNVKVSNEAVDHEVTIRSAYSLFDERLMAKARKVYGPRHVLIVVVDDYIAFRDVEDKDDLNEYAKAASSNCELDFGAVYLLGASGKYMERVYGAL